MYKTHDFLIDPEILRELEPWKKQVDAEGSREIGQLKVDLPRTGCYNQECAMGSFIADSYVDAVRSYCSILEIFITNDCVL
jgi:2',3'-cyclic-nucleotide 2'-phosphodiesterase (5'-nucleotidase family)